MDQARFSGNVTLQISLEDLMWKTYLVYLDDVMVMGGAFVKLGRVHLKLKPQKCSIFQKEVRYFGEWYQNRRRNCYQKLAFT